MESSQHSTCATRPTSLQSITLLPYESLSTPYLELPKPYWGNALTFLSLSAGHRGSWLRVTMGFYFKMLDLKLHKVCGIPKAFSNVHVQKTPDLSYHRKISGTQKEGETKCLINNNHQKPSGSYTCFWDLELINCPTAI